MNMKSSLTLMVLVLGLVFALVSADRALAEPAFKLYGNWCGPGNSIMSAPPIDPLDEACMRHDLCYDTTGPVACECDLNFMAEIRNLPYPNHTIYISARAMYDALAMTPCDDPVGWALKQSWMWSDIANDAVSGRATPFEVPARWMHLFSRSNPYY